MNIQNAAKEAKKLGTSIRRKSYPKGMICVMPTNSVYGCLVLRGRRVSTRWQPILDDLIAGDWEIVEQTKGALVGPSGITDEVPEDKESDQGAEDKDSEPSEVNNGEAT